MKKRGIAGIKQRQALQQKKEVKGNEIEANDFLRLESQMKEFSEKLTQFSIQHQEKIKQDATFRSQFVAMCAQLGVDPLASSKSVWSSLSGVGDFYYELAVQSIEICMASRQENGGLMELDSLFNKLVRSRGKYKEKISKDDLIQSLKNLKGLGSGFQLIKTGKTYLIQSMPSEMSDDPSTIFEIAQENGGSVTVKQVVADLKWEERRAENVLKGLLHNSQAWLDLGSGKEEIYWFPSLFVK